MNFLCKQKNHIAKGVHVYQMLFQYAEIHQIYPNKGK